MTSEERISIMEKEYDIPSQVLGEEVETMCNLGEGIWEEAIAEGREANLLEQIKIKKLLNLIRKVCMLEEVTLNTIQRV